MIEILMPRLIDEAYSFIKERIKSDYKKFQITKEDLELALRSHLKYVDLWSKEVLIKEMAEGKNVEKIHVNLNISVAPKKMGNPRSEAKKKSILGIINTENHIILLGDPGAGKTTTLKYLCRKILYSELKSLEFYNFPIVITLRDLADNESIYDRLKNILGINIYHDKKGKVLDQGESESFAIRKTINEYIDNLKVLLLIDGLDELNPNKLKNYIKEIKELTTNLKHSKLILTCRSGAYNIIIDNSKIYEICPLAEKQKVVFCQKWFSDKNKQIQFMEELSDSPLMDTANRPLIMALLCSLYNKYLRLPEKPKFIYSKIIRLLIDEWDTQREIKRSSIYKITDSDKIFDFLMQFAFELTVHYEQKSYTESEIMFVIKELMQQFELPLKDLEKFLFDVEARNGIFIKSSYETYEFSHKSIQEYLSAEYILRLPSIPQELIKSYNLVNELAITVCLSSNPTVYFCNLILNIFKYDEIYFDDYYDDYNPIEVFLDRLLIEKPDFEVSPILSYTFLYIFHCWWLRNPQNINDLSLYNAYEFDTKRFISLLKSFLKFKTVKKSFKKLGKLVKSSMEYKPEDRDEDSIISLGLSEALYLRNFQSNNFNDIYITSKIFKKCFPKNEYDIIDEIIIDESE